MKRCRAACWSLAAWLGLGAAAEGAAPSLPEKIDAAMAAGDYHAARPLAEMLLAQLRRTPAKSLEAARVQHVLGSIRDRLGDHAQALTILEEAVLSYQKSGAGKEELGACRDEAGRAALATGNYPAAARLLSEAIADRSGAMASHSRSALAEALLRLGRADEARLAWETALKEAGEDAAARCFALRGLGLHAHTTGAWEAAVKHFQSARSSAASLGAEGPALQAALDGQIGQSLLRAGRAAEAAPLLEEAATWFDRNGGSDDEKAAAWNNLATLWLENGEAAKAAERLTKLLESPDSAALAASPQAAPLWLNLAAARQRAGDAAAAAATLTKASTLAARHLPAVHPLRIQIALTGATIAADQGDHAAAASAAAEASRLALAWMEQASAWPDDSRLLEFHATIDAISPLAALASGDTAALATAVLKCQEAVPEILLTRRRWEARAGAEALTAWRLDPAHAPGPPRPDRPDFRALQAALPGDAVLVNFVRFRSYKGRGAWDAGGRYGALVIAKSGPARWVDVGAAGPIETRVRRIIAAARDAVAAGGESAERASITWQLASLYNMIWAPLGLTAETGRRTLLRPDALLHFVPWAVLTDPAGNFLCESGQVIEPVVFPRAGAGAKTGSIWQVLAAGSPPGPELPPFKDPLSSLIPASLLETLHDMPALPGVTAEADAIRSVAPAGVQVLHPVPVESAFAPPAGKVPAESGRGVIHFAGHGFVCEEEGATGGALLRAGLVMSDCGAGLQALASGQPRPAAADGLLFSTDAAALPLEGVDAVFLSGCQTGLGHWKAGGQLSGLRHAFLIAGAGAVGSTLWDLNDEAAPELVRAIYTELAAGTPPVAAVWRGQRAWLQSPAARKLTPGMRAALAGSWIAEGAGWTPATDKK